MAEKVSAPARQSEEVNPHNPKFLTSAPWWVGDAAEKDVTLDHQRSTTGYHEYDKMDQWYARGEKEGPAPTKFRKGACKNCGAMSHKEKDCCERPRKVGAKYTGKDLQADEKVQKFNLTYDAKRDRWNGYDVEEQKKHLELHEAVEQVRKKKREEEVGAEAAEAVDEDLEADTIRENGAGDSGAAGGQAADTKTRTTVRNLRIREDTARYLFNLDLNSAFYDPKARSMRENPLPDISPDKAFFPGNNWINNTGDTMDFTNQQVFAWSAADKGQEVHLQGAPSHAALLYKQSKGKLNELKGALKSDLLAKYGGEEHLKNKEVQELTMGEDDTFRQYSGDGRLVKGQEKVIPQSKYEGKANVNNHASCFGSWYGGGEWGYACCKQTVKQSYCLNAKKSEAKAITA